MIALKEVTYVDVLPKSSYIVLAGDIGGTNSNFGICSIEQGVITLLFSLHIKSKEITDFPPVAYQVLKYIKTNHEIDVHHACFAAAGVVSENHDFCKPTNLDFVLDTHKIIEKTGLELAVIINDFEAVGYGVDRIADNDLNIINKGEPRANATRAIIGAGTGLGKGILGWDHSMQAYMPIPSEGGHVDFPVHTQLEFDFMKFVQNTLGNDLPISWEHVLSGNGIIKIYNFLGQLNQYQETQYTKEIAEGGPNPDQIFKYWQQDPRCADTFKWYG